jgi:hypothetical protein
MTLSKIKIATVFLVVVGILGLAALARQAAAQKPAAEADGSRAAEKSNHTANQSTRKGTKSALGASGNERTALTGLVFDAGGKPLAGARVAVLGRTKSPSRLHQGSSEARMFDQGRSDREGRFRLRIPLLTTEHFLDAFLLAAKPGHGLGYRQLLNGQRKDVPVYLTKESVIRGRLFDLQGRPASGVRVGVVWINGVVAAQKAYVLFHVPEPPRDWPFWPGPAVSDAQGRFNLRGLGPELRIKVGIGGEKFARQQFEIGPEQRKRQKEFRYSLAPARIVEGTVTFADTRKPVAGARLLVHARRSMYDFGPWTEPVRVRADPQGRFRVVPHTGHHLTVLAYAPAGTPYLMLRKELDWPQADLLKQKVDLALPRGILVRGTVTEKPSGKAVAGAGIQFDANRDNNRYFREDIQPFMVDWQAPCLSGPDGKYAIAVLPGPGHLIIKGPTLDYVYQEIGTKKLSGVQVNPDWRNHVEGLVSLNLKPQPGPFTADVTLRRGVTLRGKVVGPDRKPVSGAVLLSRVYLPSGLIMNPTPSKEVKDGRFELPGCDPDKPVQVFFYDSKGLLGGVATLIPRQAKEKPVTVRLERCGTVTARFVDKQGKPVPNVRAYLDFVITPGIPFADSLRQKGPVAETGSMQHLDSQRFNNLRSDLQGHITFPALIPGAPYFIVGENPNRGLYVLKKDFQVKAGQTRDLGDIRVGG